MRHPHFILFVRHPHFYFFLSAIRILFFLSAIRILFFLSGIRIFILFVFSLVFSFERNLDPRALNKISGCDQLRPGYPMGYPHHPHFMGYSSSGRGELITSSASCVVCGVRYNLIPISKPNP
jgi:hypothetical protein